MTEELEQLLKNLKLKRMPERLRRAVTRRRDGRCLLLGVHRRPAARAMARPSRESALEWRIGRANLPERWSLESFPYTRQPGVNRKQIRAFAELDFVAKHENLVFVGPTGVGKTGLACGLLLKALQKRSPLSVRARAGSVRRDVRIAGR